MKNITTKDGQSADLIGDNIEYMKQLFPEAFSENGVDFDVLRQLLGDASVLDEGEEKYGLNWHGKKKARQIAWTPSMGTLLPCPDESVDWNTTQNLFIEGENLEVLKLLQKSYADKVKLIYIDPPYNTGKEFIYPDNYQFNLDTYLKYTGQKDEEGLKLTSNIETGGRKHTNWLNMMYPRLMVAKNLLSQDGFIFLSIGDHEQSNLKKICDDVFGEENFGAQFIWNTEGHTDNQYDVKVNHEYVLLYSKTAAATVGHVVDPNTPDDSNLLKGFAENSCTKNGSANPPSEVLLPVGFPCGIDQICLEENSPNEEFYKQVLSTGYITRELTNRYDVTYPIRLDEMKAENGKLVRPCRVYTGWANVEKLKGFIRGGCKPIVEENGNVLSFYLSKNGVIYYRRDRERARNVLSVLRNVGTTEQMRSEIEGLGIPFQYPKPKKLLKYLIRIGAENGGYVLDFFAGSCTTAQAVLEHNLDPENPPVSFLLTQLPEPIDENDAKQKTAFEFCKGMNVPENIAEIGKERIRRVISNLQEKNPAHKCDLGFKVFKLAESNIRAWNPDRTDLKETLLSHQEHLLEGRTEQDLLYELLLKRGVDLAVPIETREVAGKIIYSIGAGVLFACLDPSLNTDEIEPVAEGILAWQKELDPEGDTHVFFRDSAFNNDNVAKTNMVAILEQNGVTHVRSI